MIRTSVFIFLILFLGCRQSPEQLYDIQKTAFSDKAMVVSAHPLATKAGVKVLENGGSAVDAAIAVQLALAVVYPRAGNIGGGGFMVFRSADGKCTTLDYRERGPGAAHRDMYLDSIGNVIPGLSTKGHLAAGVPGTIDGLVTAHKAFGKIPWNQLVSPAIRYANEGFQITQREADRLNRYKENLLAFNDTSAALIKTDPWMEGDLLTQKDLASTLKRIAEHGREGFYSGKTADLIVEEMQRGKGLISHADLQNYQSKWREPLTTEYKEYTILSMPPPSSGGVALAQLMELVEPFPLNEWGFHHPNSIHVMAEAERRVYADRAKHLGDNDFYPVPVDSLMDAEYLESRMADFRMDTVTMSESISAGGFNPALESFETTHLSVVDTEGNAVSVTTTLNSNYGCKVIVDGAGFVLNNEMDDFSAKPGVPNQFGLLGAEANAIEAGKRMLSSMTPTIVEKNDGLFMVLGTPGGSTIITTVFQVILNVIEFRMDITEAVGAKRFHHQWLPDRIVVEKGTFGPVQSEEMSARGHIFHEVSYIGLVEAIHVKEDGVLEGAADDRGDDHAEGL